MKKRSNNDDLTQEQLAEISRARSTNPPEPWASISERLGVPYLADLGAPLEKWTEDDVMKLRMIWQKERQESILRVAQHFDKKQEHVEDQLVKMGFISSRLNPDIAAMVMAALNP